MTRKEAQWGEVHHVRHNFQSVRKNSLHSTYGSHQVPEDSTRSHYKQPFQVLCEVRRVREVPTVREVSVCC